MLKRPHFAYLSEALAGAQVRLASGSPLFHTGEGGGAVSLNTDRSIFPHVLAHREWHFADMERIATALPDQPHHLIDIGANSGLFTRQALINFDNVASATCFEPSPENIGHLESNVAALPARVCGFGLGAEDGTLTFYRDTMNGGNYSFIASAVEGRPFDTIEAPIRRISPDLLSRMAPEGARANPFFWKSDTQGMDETLMSSLPLEFWARVNIAMFEAWRIDKPAYDRAAFRAVLENFPHIYFKGARRSVLRESTVDAVLDFLDGTDRKWGDVCVTRHPVDFDAPLKSQAEAAG